tara:strand:+ start:912 stop:1292 length:381 start_codon:yes stop_codon:yes gene_type:complete
MTLEKLENDYWAEPTHESRLIKTCHQLRKKPLKEFEIEDLRILIGQNISLPHLIPIAIDRLKDNILVEGDYYEGDLLNAVLTSDKDFWKQEPELHSQLEKLINSNEQLLMEHAANLWKAFEAWKLK